MIGESSCEETWLSIKGRVDAFDKYRSQEGYHVRLVSCLLYLSPPDKYYSGWDVSFLADLLCSPSTMGALLQSV